MGVVLAWIKTEAASCYPLGYTIVPKAGYKNLIFANFINILILL
ncbi:MAG: hypothetical protein ACFB02_15425 [Mastigocoleus sp.]